MSFFFIQLGLTIWPDLDYQYAQNISRPGLVYGLLICLTYRYEIDDLTFVAHGDDTCPVSTRSFGRVVKQTQWSGNETLTSTIPLLLGLRSLNSLGCGSRTGSCGAWKR